jgi:Cu+-exporting ATPase
MNMGGAAAAPQAPASAAPTPPAMSGMNMGIAAPPAAPSAAAVGQYTCAMHPNVVSSGPGKCPYCGMALTKRP